MKRAGSISAAGLAALLAHFCAARWAEAAEGTRLCAIQEVLECSPVTGCDRVSAADVGLPDFLRVDPQANGLRGIEPGDDRQTAARAKEVVDGTVILAGIEKHRGWSVVLTEDGRRLTGTVTEGEGAFVVFGVCAKD